MLSTTTAAGFRRSTLLTLAVIAGVISFIYVAGGFHHKVAPSDPVERRPALAVEGHEVRVVRRRVDNLMAWPGTVRAHAYVELAPKVSGRILAVNVRPGDRVQSGQVLAVLDDREIRSRIEAAEAALTSAQAQVAQISAEERRTQTLYAQHAATLQELQAVTAQAQAARAAVDQARSRLSENKTLASESTLKAPFAGAVVRRLADPGVMGMPGQPILALQDLERLELEADIPSGCATGLLPGKALQARIDPRELPAEVPPEIPVEIKEVAPAIDAASRTLKLKCFLPPGLALKPGAFIWLLQACGQAEVLLIPQVAVHRQGQLEQVYVRKDGGLRLRLIKTGKTHAAEVEVLSGLDENETILVPAKTP